MIGDMASTLSEAGKGREGSRRKKQEQRKNGKHDFNPDFTQSVIDATGPKAHRRVRQLTAGLVRHLHDFVRENEVTVEEFMMGIDIVCSLSSTVSSVISSISTESKEWSI